MDVASIILYAFLALLTFIPILFTSLFITWFVLNSWFIPVTAKTLKTSRESNRQLNMALFKIFKHFGRLPLVIISTVLKIGFHLLAQLRTYLLLLILSFALFGVCVVAAEYHDRILHQGLIYNLSIVRPIMDNFVLPLISLISIVASMLVPVFNFFAGLAQFLVFGGPQTFFECTLESFSFSNLMSYFLNMLKALFSDVSAYLLGSPLRDEFNIKKTLAALGDVGTIFLPTFNCFCRMFNFVWTYFIGLLNMSSLHSFINNFINIPVRFMQLAPGLLTEEDHIPRLDNLTLTACATVQDLGTGIEEVVYLTVELAFGLITRKNDLPPKLADFLSIPLTGILTHPVCGVFRLANMTVTGGVHTAVAAIGLSGKTVNASFLLNFLKFDAVFDEFRLASIILASTTSILQIPDTVSLVANILLAVVNGLNFLIDWIITSTVYLIFGMTKKDFPFTYNYYNVSINDNEFRNILHYNFVDFWLQSVPLSDELPLRSVIANETVPNYSNLDKFFRNLVIADQNLGNLIGLLNPPLGSSIRHLLNLVVGLLKFVLNALFYGWTLLSFKYDCPGNQVIDNVCVAPGGSMPTKPFDIDIDYFFNETFFFAGAVGDIFRQFTGNSTEQEKCQNPQTLIPSMDHPSAPGRENDSDQTFWCAMGNLLETAIDLIALLLRDLLYFLLDALGLASGEIRFCLFGAGAIDPTKRCVRLVDFDQEILILQRAILSAALSLTGIIPADFAIFKCSLPFAGDGTQSCGRVQTCLANFLASLLELLLVAPAKILNSLIVNIISKSAYEAAETFIASVVHIVVDQLAQILETMARLLDCMVCAFARRCASSIYDILKPVADAIRKLADAITGIFLKLIKLILLLFVGIFTKGGNPLKAILDFVIAIFTDIGFSIASILVKFIVEILNAMHLNILGTIISVIWGGLCYVLQGVFTVIFGLIYVLSFFTYKKEVNLCCDGDLNCVPKSFKRDGDILDPTVIITNAEEWLREVAEDIKFPEGDRCQETIARFGQYNWSKLDQYEKGETIYCLYKDAWSLRDDNQTLLDNSTCDGMVMGMKHLDWREITILERHTLMNCVNWRLYTEVFRNQTGLHWIPQDIMTNDFRKVVFAAELGRGYFINWQFQSDRTKPAEVILTPAYRQYWADLKLSTAHYDNLTTVEEVNLFKNTSHLTQYFEANNAKQYDAVLYTVTGFYSVLDKMWNSVVNATYAMGSNETDPAVYLDFNYTLDNSQGATSSALFGILSEVGSMVSQFTGYWKNPDNYKKRQEAYASLSELHRIGVYEIYHQIRLSALEAIRARRNAPKNPFFNSTCSTRDECEIQGVLEYADKYHESFYKAIDNETSIVYKLSHWWETADFTTYPMRKTRYPSLGGPVKALNSEGESRMFRYAASSLQDEMAYRNGIYMDLTDDDDTAAMAGDDDLRVDSDGLLSYKDTKTGQLKKETRLDRLWRYYDFVKEGTPASNRRWATVTGFLTYVKYKLYTKVLKGYYGLAEYRTTEHHRYMQQQHERRTRILTEHYNRHSAELREQRRQPTSATTTTTTKKRDSAAASSDTTSQGLNYFGTKRSSLFNRINPSPILSESFIANEDGSQGRLIRLRPVGLDYDANVEPPVEETLSEEIIEARILNLTQSTDIVPLQDRFIAESLVRVSAYMRPQALHTIEIEFPCRYPLECNTTENVTGITTLAAQCRYLQDAVDRTLSLVETLLYVYGSEGFLSRTFNDTFRFMKYTYNKSAPVFVGNSPHLHVATFPKRGATFVESFTRSMAYLDDMRPNKIGLSDHFNLTGSAEALLGSDFRNTTLFTRAEGLTFYMLKVAAYVLYVPLQVVVSVVASLANFVDSPGSLINTILRKDILCDYGRDLRGENGRFSIMQIIVIYTVIGIPGAIISVTLFGFNVVTIFSALGLGLVVIIWGTLFLHGETALLCSGVPIELSNSIFHAVAYNLFPKCPYQIGALVKQPYTNLNCYDKEAVANLKLYHCTHELGFTDILSNVVFALHIFRPSWLETIRNLPGIHFLYQNVAFVSARLDRFSALGDITQTDDFTFATYITCGWLSTLYNLGIFQIIPVVAGFLAVVAIAATVSLIDWFDALFDLVTDVFYLIFDTTILNPVPTDTQSRKVYMDPRYYRNNNNDDDGGGGGDDDDDDGDDDRNIEKDSPPKERSAAIQQERSGVSTNSSFIHRRQQFRKGEGRHYYSPENTEPIYIQNEPQSIKKDLSSLYEYYKYLKRKQKRD